MSMASEYMGVRIGKARWAVAWHEGIALQAELAPNAKWRAVRCELESAKSAWRISIRSAFGPA
jgi:hypothetical protein